MYREVHALNMRQLSPAWLKRVAAAQFGSFRQRCMQAASEEPETSDPIWFPSPHGLLSVVVQDPLGGVGHGGEVQELPEPPKTPRRRIPLS